MTSRRGAHNAWQSRDEEPRSRLARLATLAALASLLWLSAALLYHATRPILGPATLLLPGEAPRQFAYPFALQHVPRTKFTLRQQLWLPRFHPTTFVFYPQDFLWSVSVNGNQVRVSGLPLSAASCEGHSIDLAPFLHPGINEIELQMEARWGDERLQLGVSPWDKYVILLLALVLLATCATSALISIYSRFRPPWAESALLLAGIALRYVYFLGTPYFVRSFDYWGHVDYLDYIVQHFALPPTKANWEAFQPPLYYLVNGVITRPLLSLGMAEEQRYVLWQGISLLISIGVLIAGYSIARTLYEQTDRARLYMLALFAVAPPLVFNAARVSNDCLLTLLSFIWLALLLRYWQWPQRRTWIWLALVLGLALLTKANALVLVAISAICLVIHPRLNRMAKIRGLIVLVAISTAISGWYYLPRALHTSALDTYVVGNLHSLSSRARIDNVLIKSLIFNPFKVVRYPFADAWGPRNDVFLEVLFKTMLLGGWIKGAFYKPLARFMVIVALPLIPVCFIGIYKAITQGKEWERPLLIALGGVFLAQWLFLQSAPYLSTQDFRYSVILLVPMAWFLLRGLESLPYHIKIGATFLLQIAILNSAIYLLALALGD